ncbi:MAG: helix-turn-helix domain-containing protein [Opitutaceae bacterium]|nr:helix-turn-helix domain-containing protein [Opitutaceae bacterium]
MPARPDTPAPTPGPLISGTYRVGPRFVTYRENGTNDWVLVCNLSGHARFGHIGGDLLTGPGDMILLKPHTRHDYGTAPGQSHWEPLWAHFLPRPAWLEWLDWPEVAPGILRLHLPKGVAKTAIIARFQYMLQVGMGGDRVRRELAMNALEEIILRCDRFNPGGENSLLDTRIRVAVDFLNTNFAEPLSVALIARRCGLSPSRFARLFKAQTGETPQRYLETQRLNRARQLLEFTQAPIRQIAGEVGFENPFYFTLRFKRQHGASPRAWRRQIAPRRAP